MIFPPQLEKIEKIPVRHIVVDLHCGTGRPFVNRYKMARYVQGVVLSSEERGVLYIHFRYRYLKQSSASKRPVSPLLKHPLPFLSFTHSPIHLPVDEQSKKGSSVLHYTYTTSELLSFFFSTGWILHQNICIFVIFRWSGQVMR